MTPLARAWLAFIACVIWGAAVAPEVASTIEAARTEREAPLRVETLRRQILLLPAPTRRKPVVTALSDALDVDRVLSKKEQAWNIVVAAQLSDGERATAYAGARLDEPSPPPPPESPSCDGDVLALARALLDEYGWAPAGIPSLPDRDPWAGADRRARARGLLALVRSKALNPARAHIILAVTLDFLESAANRSQNQATIRTLFQASLAQARSVHPSD